MGSQRGFQMPLVTQENASRSSRPHASPSFSESLLDAEAPDGRCKNVCYHGHAHETDLPLQP
eukprot:1710450-Amphidinium_carterae.1